MKISLDWLASWLPLDEAPPMSPTGLCDILTASGLEVEGLEELPAVPGGLKGMVVGEVGAGGPPPQKDQTRRPSGIRPPSTPMQPACASLPWT